MRLLILGAGQYGLVAKEIAEAMGKFDQIDFLDDQSDIAVGRLRDIDTIQYDVAVVAIGNPIVRSQWLKRAHHLATLVHPKAVVMPSATIEEGSIIEAGAVVSGHARIGKGCIVMANTVVGHDSTVGDCCLLKYNCTIPERFTVPNRTKVSYNVVFAEIEEE